MELGIKQLITVVLTLLVAVSLLGFAGRINSEVDGAFDTQIKNFTSTYSNLNKAPAEEGGN